ncbi:hypothetical protein ACTWP6_29430 [Mycobacterium sp. 4D054]|uniref:hypothetical protein n=1 Tax=Mycobacterium sp. 4D054 TaxID=3457440 RepID=UPI003FD1E922
MQVAKFRADLEKLPTVTDIYDFGLQRALLEMKIAALQAGEAVEVQAVELADELLSKAGLRSRFDRTGMRLFRIEDDRLVPADDSAGCAGDASGSMLPL